MLVSFALKEIGREHLTEEQKAHVLGLLQKEDKHGIQHDLALMPDWIQTIVMEAIDNR